MRKTKKSLTRQLAETKAELKRVRLRLEEVERDRQELRDYFAGKYKWFLELLEKRNTPNLSWLILDMTKKANALQKWWWD